ncbi:YbaN family protein [Breznakiella homolactica]|uniref:YbaN family protein n=1 Tax=Breznakiella homolactica TaxID=2798577 RepID=A0A7T7XL40_9SPIR|nr:YbaN family protein [Breznakiella homolactica]QQO08197.1 YbaN family protein [Breznakiella homolactica]
MKKILLLISGIILTVLGGLGVFLPILPTTPFVILAALCFSFSSPKLYNFLIRNKYFGPYIENYRTKKGVPLASKVRGIAAVWILLAFSAVFMQKLWASILFACIAIGVTIHLLCIKTLKPEAESAPREEIAAAKK